MSRDRAKRRLKREKYMRDREKLPMFPLAKVLADELGDIPEATLITQPEFKRVLFRIADIRAGRIKKSNRNEQNARAERNADRKLARLTGRNCGTSVRELAAKAPSVSAAVDARTTAN